MSLLERFFGREDEVDRSREPTFAAAGEDFASTDAYPEWFRDFVIGPKSAAGKIVTPATAMRLSAVFAAVNLRGGTLAQCPMKICKVTYSRKRGEVREPDPKHPLYRILHDQPNPIQTSMDFVQMLQMHADLRGAGYARIVRDGAGRVMELWPMHPARTQLLVAQDGRTAFYDWLDPRTNKKIRLAQREVFHLRGLSDDLWQSLSRVQMAKERLGISMAAEEYSGKLLANDARPSVVLKHPKKIGEDNLKRLRDQWGEAYGGSAKAGKTAILEEGMEVQLMQMTNRDAQFIELLNLGVKDIARFFDVPGFLIGDDGKTATYASALQAVLMFEKFTMAEIARNWELTVKRDLLREDEREKWYAEVELQALQRGDFAQRMEGYQRSVGGPWMLANEARRSEGLSPVDGGDKLYPAPSAKASPSQEPSAPGGAEEPEEPLQEEDE